LLVAYGNGVMTRHTYDLKTFRLIRLCTERYAQPDALTYHPTDVPLQDFAYEYDLVGNITAIHDRAPGSGIPNNPNAASVNDPILAQLLASGNALIRRFEYDPIYHLLRAAGRECDTLPPAPPWDDTPKSQDVTLTRAYNEIYRYDRVGNIEQMQHQAVGG